MTTISYPERTELAPVRTTVLTDTWYLTGRRLRALIRQPWVVAFGVIQPAIWLFLFGEMFRRVIDIPGFGYQGSYLAYLVPGIVAMNGRPVSSMTSRARTMRLPFVGRIDAAAVASSVASLVCSAGAPKCSSSA